MLIKKVDFGIYEEAHITINETELKNFALDQFLSNLKLDGFLIIKVIFFGHKPDSDLKSLENKLPVGFLGGFDSSDKSIYIHTIKISERVSDLKFEYIRGSENKIIGCFLRVGVDIFLFKTGSDFSKKDLNVEDELFEEYMLIDKLLTLYGLQWKSVYRFWNYMSDIFHFYSPFNKIRDSFFDKNKVEIYPAATGIQASLLDNRKIFIGFEAISSSSVKIHKIFSDMQNEANEYGPRFSRAMTLRFPNGKRKVYISGTSSISKEGLSLFENDIEKNVSYTLKSVENLLVKEGLSLENIVSSIVYCKTVKVKTFFEKVYMSRGLSFPHIEIMTPICRKDLIFEIECIAVG